MWHLAFNASAAKAFKKLDGQTQRAIKAKLLELQALADPAILAKPLMHDLKGRFRVRVGSYRVIFSLERGELVILVVDVGPRDSIYD